MVQDDRQLKIREMEEGEEFSAWFHDLCEDSDAETLAPEVAEERHLVLTDEIGDWIGGLKWSLRGGVAQVLDLAIVPRERHQGHAHRLLTAFEEHAAEQGARILELWTDHENEVNLLGGLGWDRLLRRSDYIGGRTWYLLEKRLVPAD